MNEIARWNAAVDDVSVDRSCSPEPAWDGAAWRVASTVAVSTGALPDAYWPEKHGRELEQLVTLRANLTRCVAARLASDEPADPYARWLLTARLACAAAVAWPTDSAVIGTEFTVLDIARKMGWPEDRTKALFGPHEFERRLVDAALRWSECLRSAETDARLWNADHRTIEHHATCVYDALVSTGRGRAALDQMAENLLPRFAWRPVVVRAWAGDGTLVPLAWIAGTAAAAASLYRGTGAAAISAASWFMAAAFALILAVTVKVGVIVLYPMCLRLAAGSAVGMAALLSTSNWSESTQPYAVSAALVGAVFAYTIYECRAHVDSAAAALRRGAVATAIAVVHGCTIATFVLASVGRQVFGADVGSESPLRLVFYSGTLSVLIGIVAQVLWSDRTVLSPLDRTRWKGK